LLGAGVRHETRKESEIATVVAQPGYPAQEQEQEPEKHTITIVVPSGATIVGLMPGDDQVRVRHEGVASTPRALEPDAPAATLVSQEIPVADSLLVLDDDPPAEDPPAAVAAQIEAPALPAAHPQRPEPPRPRRRWRVALTSLLSLGVLAAGLLGTWRLSKDLAPQTLVELMEQCREQLQRLPGALRERAERLELSMDGEETNER
jgi:hypothetical protein